MKLLNAATDLAHKMINNGYAEAWFNWIEWVGITALIFVAAKRTHSVFLYLVGGMSTLMLFFVGLAGVEKLQDTLTKTTVTQGKLANLLITFLICVTGLFVVMNVLFELLPASID